MANPTTDQYSAGEQGLGYIYQPRFALLRLLQLPESTSVLIEKDDDLDFLDQDGVKTLASLKHKAVGDRMSDLSIDFWKSVRIWLTRYNRDGRSQADLRFFLFTTATVSEKSFLRHFLPDHLPEDNGSTSLSQLAGAVLTKTKSDLIGTIATALHELSDKEKDDFFSRIVIFDGGPRIVDVPLIIKDQHMRKLQFEIAQASDRILDGGTGERA